MLRHIRSARDGGIQRHSQMGVSDLSQLVVPEKEADYPSVEMVGWLPAFGVYWRHAEAITWQNLERLPQSQAIRAHLRFLQRSVRVGLFRRDDRK